MALSAFDDRSSRPDEARLRSVLGPAWKLWAGARDFMESNWEGVEEEWAFSSKSAGWSVRLRLAGRIIVYLIPQHGYFLAGFVLGDRAVEEARRAALPDRVRAQLEAARKFAEGTGFRFEVRTDEDLRALERLATIKVS